MTTFGYVTAAQEVISPDKIDQLTPEIMSQVDGIHCGIGGSPG